MRSASLTRWLTPLALLSVVSVASAHPGSSMHNLMDGLTHPLTGLDHLLAMVAVGVWAAMGGGKRIWLVPATFIVVLTAGLALGRIGGALPMTDMMIALTVIALGLLIAGRILLPTTLACIAAGAFALFHGVAHGAEIPAQVAAWHFAAGMVISTAILHSAGIILGLSVRRLNRDVLIRLGGAGAALCGVLMALGAM